MISKVTFADFPVDLLTMIFSFLPSKEILKSSLVSKKFFQASKHGSLWKSSELTFSGEEKLLSFCSFFSESPHLQNLSLSFADIRPSSLRSGFKSQSLRKDKFEIGVKLVNALNRMLNGNENLSCFNVSEIDISKLTLPRSLSHLSCDLSWSGNEPISPHFAFIEQCPNIERLFLRLRKSRSNFSMELDSNEKSPVTNDVKRLLKKYRSSLQALYLDISYFDIEWMPLISKCHNLKELGMKMSFDVLLKQPDLDGLASLPCLQVLFIQNWVNFRGPLNRTLLRHSFQEVTHFAITECSSLELEDLELICVKMPNLEIFYMNNNFICSSDICKFISRCKNLKYIALHPIFRREEPEMTAMLLRINEGRCPENKWYFFTNNMAPGSIVLGRIGEDKFSCTKCYIYEMEAYRCHCWAPNHRFCSGGSKHQWRPLLNICDDHEKLTAIFQAKLALASTL